MTGPCYPEASKVVCRFGNIDVQGELQCYKARCIVPQQFENITTVDLQVSIDGGDNFDFTGEFVYSMY